MDSGPSDITNLLQAVPPSVLYPVLSISLYLWIFDHAFARYGGLISRTSSLSRRDQSGNRLPLERSIMPSTILLPYRRMLHGALLGASIFLAFYSVGLNLKLPYQIISGAFIIYVGLLMSALLGEWMSGNLSPRALHVFGWVALVVFRFEDYIFEPFALGMKSMITHEMVPENLIERSHENENSDTILRADLTISDVMIPRVDLPVVDEHESLNTLILRTKEKNLGIAIVVRTTRKDDVPAEEVVGIIRLTDILNWLIHSSSDSELRDKPVRELPIIKPPVFADSQRLITVWHEWNRLSDSPGVALVYDEFGSFQGVVFRDAIMEALLLSIHQELESQFIQKEGDGWRVRGRCPIEIFWQAIGKSAEELPSGVETVAGWVGSLFAHIPAQGETIEDQDLYIKVTQVQNHRIEEVFVRKRKREHHYKDEQEKSTAVISPSPSTNAPSTENFSPSNSHNNVKASLFFYRNDRIR